MKKIEPEKVYRGTWVDLIRHRDEIPAGAILELKVYEPEFNLEMDEVNPALIGLYRCCQIEAAGEDNADLPDSDLEQDCSEQSFSNSKNSQPSG
jgi:hypothetical protein